jgi:hypothetical protein
MLLACPDKEGIHALIIALDDKRVFNPSAALPSGNPSTSPDRMVLTVGKRAEQVLPDIIGCDKFSRYRVSDWRQWWTANQNKSLDEIRDEVKLVNSQK